MNTRFDKAKTVLLSHRRQLSQFRIRDILQAIDNIEQYTKNMTASEFKKNKLVADAVIRN